ncbi:hypothetical protein BB560_002924 [Smittium megazygosporum]|uniref:Uncharacterized protein n=1 Tax=Smittium megazygosporum TaxID=133381 RepID=A0A2T9ZDG0_9FUNG|nr:hypothetical protein BB560_002924 [Smittium megazygosporum]
MSFNFFSSPTRPLPSFSDDPAQSSSAATSFTFDKKPHSPTKSNFNNLSSSAYSNRKSSNSLFSLREKIRNSCLDRIINDRSKIVQSRRNSPSQNPQFDSSNKNCPFSNISNSANFSKEHFSLFNPSLQNRSSFSNHSGFEISKVKEIISQVTSETLSDFQQSELQNQDPSNTTSSSCKQQILTDFDFLYHLEQEVLLELSKHQNQNQIPYDSKDLEHLSTPSSNTNNLLKDISNQAIDDDALAREYMEYENMFIEEQSNLLYQSFI